MKIKILLIAVLGIFLLNSVSAACTVDVVMVNQDPYPAMPGEYVKIIFQVSGISSPDCKNLRFWVDDSFPFSLDPGVEREVIMNSGTYVKDYKDFFLVPYRVRVHENALDGDNEIATTYSFEEGTNAVSIVKKFNITVEDSRTDFEIYVKDYSSATKKLTLDILNTGSNNVEALTLDIPKQDNIDIYGTNRVVIGDLDSNEEDFAIFQADLKEGEIKVNLYYTDQIDERRQIEKSVYFDPSYFNKTISQSKGISAFWTFVIGLLIPLAFFYIRKKIKKRKEVRKRN
jgi:hypothetical protein